MINTYRCDANDSNPCSYIIQLHRIYFCDVALSIKRAVDFNEIVIDF